MFDRTRAVAGLVVLTMLAFPFSFAKAQKLQDVTIALSSAGFSIGNLRLAEEAGLFRNHAINAKFVVMDSGNAATAALLSGSAQFVASGPATVIAARARRQAIVCVVNIYRGLSASLAISKAAAAKIGVDPRAPVIERLRALEGMTIAVPSATSAFLGPLKRSAEALGINIKFSYMAQPAMPAALESGAIQGMMAGPTTVIPSLRKGTAVQWIDGPGSELPEKFMPTSSSCLQTTEQYAKANPAILAGMKSAMEDAGRMVESNPERAKQVLAKAFSKIEPELLGLLFEAESKSWTRPTFTVADIQQEIDLLKASGQQIPGLEQVDPRSVLAESPR